MDKYIGTLLSGRYKIIDVLGIGGMAIVYKARCGVLNRYVAIKMLKEEFLQDEEFRRRFYNESQAVAKLSHNNIVAVYDVARTETQDYIVMEFIEGISLKEYLQKKGHLSWQETVFFAQQIAKGLNHAHSRGIIHQDIKPHNIMLLRDGTVKVTDFGIAKLESNQETRVVQDAIGSVHYIAPEQAKGSSIDARADIYSLGVVMYEMLTGKLPFDGDTAVSIVMQHINSVPEMPSRVMNGVPRGMDDIVMHAMCPNVSRRYSTAQELYQDLERIKQNPHTIFGYTASNRGDSTFFEQTRTMDTQVYQQNQPNYNQQNMYQQQLQQRPPQRPQQQAPEYAKRRQNPNNIQGRNPNGDIRRKRRNNSPMIVAGIFVAVVAVLAIFIGGKILMKNSEVEKKVAVPNLIGENIDIIFEKQSTQYADFNIVVASKSEYNPAYKKGDVIRQIPDPDEEVEKGSKITLFVCGEQIVEEEKGYELADFSNSDLKEVERILKENGLENSYKIVEEFNDTIESGYVIRTSPASGAVVKPSDEITIYVSKGKKIELVKVPNVTGMTLDSATAMLASYGLNIGNTYNEYNDSPVGQVFKQSIVEGTDVEKNTKIELYISKGKQDEQKPTESNNNENTSVGNENTNSSQTVKTGKASVEVMLPDTESCYVAVYLGSEKLSEKIFSPASGSQIIEVTGPVGEQMLDIYIDGKKTSNIYTFE